MTDTPPPPPGQPDEPRPPFPPHPPRPGQWPAHPGPVPPPAKSRRGLVIGLVAGAVVAVLLCGGCLTAGLVSYLDGGSGEADSAATAVGGGAASAGASRSPDAGGASCGAAGQVAEPAGNAVGMPDFAGAPRSGTATMRITTNLGQITVAMDRAQTPCTVASFAHLAGKRYFDGGPCHRLVTEGLSILQCGDPTGTGTGRPDYAFTDENLTGARYTRGVVAMANAGAGTNGSQFFIVFKDGQLDPLYTPFGTVTAGMEIVDQVAAGGHDNSITAGGGKPNVAITIQSLSVE